MKNYNNYEERVREVAEKAETRNEMYNNLQEVINDIMNEDTMLISTDKKLKGYGTWEVTLWVNEYRFGENLKKALNGVRVITHDEDRIFTVEDLRDEVTEAVEEFAYELF